MAEDVAQDWRDWGTREIIPVRDALVGETDADNFRHCIVRGAFLREFWVDEKVQSAVSHWGKITGLEECAVRLTCSADRLAELAGLVSRGELWGLEELIVDEDRAREAEEALADVNIASEAFLHRLSHLEQVDDLAVAFVKELGLPYPWLAMELIGYTGYAIFGFALGVKFRFDGWYEPKPHSEITAPTISMSFQTRERESVEEALDRLCDEFIETAKKLIEPIPPRGKIPDRTIAALERNAQWFYRNKVRGESVRSMAKSHFGSTDRRKDIYDGISRAKELLELTQYSL